MIIVIGASSFIGVYTVEELLKQKCDVLVTGRNNRFREHYEKLGVPYVNLDLQNEADFEKLPTSRPISSSTNSPVPVCARSSTSIHRASPRQSTSIVEGVILLAALLPANAPVNLDEDENAADYFRINTIGTINVLEYCRKNGINRVISTSSYADVRNSWTSERALTEEEPRGFSYSGDHAVYVISKNAACDVLEYYNQQHGMKNAWFRFPPVYGVGPHGSLFINGKRIKSGLQLFIDKAEAGEDITIYGDKNLSRDVVYVKDVAHAFYLAMKSEKTNGLYNMTSGKGVTLQEQAEVVIELFSNKKNKRSRILYNPKIKNNTPSYLFSIEKAKRDFGFVPQYSDYKVMMTDYKADLDAHKFQNLFHY